MIKKFIFLAFIALCSLQAEVVNSVVAVVNNEPITNYELYRVQKAAGLSQEQAMEKLINEKVKISEIKKRGIFVNPNEINERVIAIAQQNKISPEQLKAAVSKQPGGYEQFREDIKQAIADEKLYSSLYRDIQQSTTPENVKKFYNQNSSLFTTFESVTLTRYIAKSPNPLNTIKAKKNARSGGVMVQRGTLKNNQMDENLRYIVTNVKEGDFSPIIPTRNGYEMFFINAKKGVKTLDFESVQQNAIQAYVMSKRQKATEEFNDRMRSNAHIEFIKR